MDESPNLAATYFFGITPAGTFDSVYNVLIVAARLHHASITMTVDGRLIVRGSSASIQATADFCRKMSSIAWFRCASPTAAPKESHERAKSS